MPTADRSHILDIRSDPRHSLAVALVRSGQADSVRLVNETGYILFSCNRVSDREYVWQTPQMAAPAFAELGARAADDRATLSQAMDDLGSRTVAIRAWLAYGKEYAL